MIRAQQRVYDVESHEGVVPDIGEMGETIPHVAEQLTTDPKTSHSWVLRYLNSVHARVVARG